MQNKTLLLLAAILGLIGAALLALGLSLVPVFDQKILEDIRSHVLPTKGSVAFDTWKNWTRFKPVYRQFHFFHVVNPEQVTRTRISPKTHLSNANFTVKGPYVYRVHFERRNVSFSENGDRLSFQLYKSYTFDKDRSAGHESDVITLVNLPILNLASRLIHSGSKIQKNVKAKIKAMNESLFSEVKVSDVLWGYENENLINLTEYLSYRYNMSILNDTTYGLMYQTGQPNRTTFEGEFEVSTELDSLWTVKKWNGKSLLSAWEPKSGCNRLNGTEGYSWSPRLDKGQPEFIFDPEWCRSIRLFPSSKSRPTVTVPGISTADFTYLDRSFSKTGDNKCFCHPLPRVGKTNQTHCLGKGVVNITSCKDNVPLVLSQPYFLGSGKEYKIYRGLKDDSRKHSTTFHLEPTTGEVVEASRKLQLNAFIQRLSSFGGTANQTMYGLPFPVVWMKEDYFMSDGEKKRLQSNVLDRIYFYKVTEYLLLTVGSLLLGLSLGVLAVLAYRHHQPKMTKSTVPERQPLLGKRMFPWKLYED